ncbi:MAG TPA: hypothetical protein VEI03_07440 [Stellaceae bacterium]|nr:hypothetical protein [Stellaceae bacterium]
MIVVASLEDFDRFRCIDVLQRPDGTFFFNEYRRDPEDAGRWTLIGDYSDRRYSTQDEALAGAESSFGWFAEVMQAQRAAAARKPDTTSPVE